jgi:hypothetical protein
VSKASFSKPNLASACSTGSSRKTKKPLKFEETEPAGAIILVGADNNKIPSDGKVDEAIKIKNKFDKKLQSGRDENCLNKKEDDVKIMNVIEPEDVVEIENPMIEVENKSCHGGLEQIENSQPISVENSPNLSQELEQINHDINNKIPNSPGDIYKSILKDGLKESCKEALSVKNSPAQKKLQNSFKRRLMDTEGNFLCSQNSQESPAPSQSTTKKLPAFARKREIPSLNTSSSFVISKNKSINKTRKHEKSDELVPEEIIPLPPARKSILKKKFLVKDAATAQTTPKLGKFDFDEKSPAKSDASWMKTDKKKKRTAGFKTKKQRLQEERAAKRKIKDEKKKDQPNKVTRLTHIKIISTCFFKLKRALIFVLSLGVLY